MCADDRNELAKMLAEMVGSEEEDTVDNSSEKLKRKRTRKVPARLDIINTDSDNESLEVNV